MLALGRISIAVCDGKGEVELIETHKLKATITILLMMTQKLSSLLRTMLQGKHDWIPGPSQLMEHIPDTRT